MATLAANPQFSTISRLIQASGLASEICQTSPMTFNAPTDCTLAALPCGLLDQIQANPDRLRQFILYQMVPGAYCVDNIRGMSCPLDSFLGCPLTPACCGCTVKLNCSNVTIPDIRACNGQIQGLDAALIPPV